MVAIHSLLQVEFKVFSQWGEDGIIDWIIERADIPPHLHTFIEFGVEDYRESNTRFLLQNRNWRGLIMDGSSAADAFLKSSGLAWQYDITAITTWITMSNINDLFTEAGFSGEIGLLSIDIDGNDYWVWESINAIQPIICICEYNAVFGDIWPLSIPYQEQFARTLPEYSNLYFGASISALRSLGARKGYRFLGTTSAGNDLFFIREDYASRFDAALQTVAIRPSKFRESRNLDRTLSYAGGLERLRLIADLPLVNTETGEMQKLKDLEPVYSEEWLGRITSSSSIQKGIR